MNITLMMRSRARKFKPLFSLTATSSADPQAVNRTVFGENFARSMII